MTEVENELRDGFAAVALTGLLSCPQSWCSTKARVEEWGDAPLIMATRAYQFADAMMEVRKRREDD